MLILKKSFIIALGILLTYTVITVLDGCSGGNKKDDAQSVPTAPASFTGSASCQSCHAKQYNDWQKSDHFLAMQEAHDSTVLGDFNNKTLVADGVTSRFFKKDGKFFINTQGDDGNYYDYEVLYTFGYFPLQQYLIAFPGGRMQATRVSWDSRDKKWFHQYPGQKVHPHDWLHWTGNGQNWNTMCASCHSTNLQKNYDFTSDTYKTTWTDINVGCESCHGAGSRHIDLVNAGAYKDGVRPAVTGLVYTSDTIPQQQLNTCAPCHARKSDIAADFAHSGELLDDLIPQVISTEFYFADGQIREEDYEYGSFAQSKMFHMGIRCSNCHNPHSGQLVKTGNDLCMSCHVPKYNTKEHHFHAENTEASQCINCHMPVKTFMGNDLRRDHSFRVPRPDQTVDFGTPNTCNSCHQDKSASWAAKSIETWHGPKRQYHFSDDLIPGSRIDNKSEKHLIALLGDGTQQAIARATAAHYLGSVGTMNSAQALLAALKEHHAIIRYYSLRSLSQFPPDVWLQPAAAALSDKVRAVRIAAADLFHQLPQGSVPATALTAYQQADAENRRYLAYQTDFAVGNVMVADYELQGGDHLGAISHYLRGLKKDSLMNYARFNLSAAYNQAGKNQEALKTLNDAAAIDPANDRTFYNLGLLYYELSDVTLAITNFDKAVRLGSRMIGLYYNYGLLLQQQGKMKESEKILLNGLSIEPRATNINYALAFLYVQQNAPQKARRHAEVLKQMDPQNPDYQTLFRNLGL